MAASMARQVARRAKEKTVLRLCMVFEEPLVMVQAFRGPVKQAHSFRRFLELRLKGLNKKE